jgi:hypothetical protein
MSRVVRTFSFEEICNIVNAHVFKEYRDNKLELTEKDGKVSVRAEASIRGNDIWGAVIRVHDDHYNGN